MSQFSGIAAFSERIFAKEFAPNADNESRGASSASGAGAVTRKRLTEEEMKVGAVGQRSLLQGLAVKISPRLREYIPGEMRQKF